jgi:hypothetical protein
MPAARKFRTPSARSAVVGVLAVSAILASPSLAAAATTATTVSSQINSVISLLSSNGTVNVNVTPTASGAQTIASDTVTVSTNDGSGYTLQLAETGAGSTMTSGGNSIPASAGTQASPIAMVANTWGYRVDTVGGFGTGPTSSATNQALAATKFAAVPATASPNTIKTTSSSASSDTTTVWYGVAATTAQAAGTYTNSVTYTVTAN